MTTSLQVLTRQECEQVHASSLSLLARTGVRVDSLRARELLLQAGAQPGRKEHILLLPPSLVEASLERVPRQFSLGGRRPGWSYPLNAGRSALVCDGGAVFTLDAHTGERRPATRDDWLLGTRLTDVLDDFSCYWGVVEGTFGERPADRVMHWVEIFRQFSKHVQEACATPEEAGWLKEILHVLFGSLEDIQQLKPLSFLICPASPLVIEAGYTDAYLELASLKLPVAIMPMPLQGATGPGTLISNLVLANCEGLAMVCLIEAAQAGTPIIYAVIPAIANPYSGRFGSGEVESSLLGAAVCAMGRFYGLPVQASTGGSDQHVPSIQAGYERALNFILPSLSHPDLLVAPGLLGGSMIFSPEQMIIDLEILRRCWRLGRGIDISPEKWLEATIAAVGPGGNFLGQTSTRDALRAGELYLSQLGCHTSYERWVEQGRTNLLDEARLEVERILAAHRMIPFPPEVERELVRISQAANQPGG